MYKFLIDNKFEIIIDTNQLNKVITVDGQTIDADFVKIKENVFHLIYKNKSLTAELLSADYASKEFQIKINNNIYTVAAQDKYDALLKKMGFDLKNSNKADDIKAPMPGLVLEIKVSEGQQIEKGDAVVVLEAMKMENILKANSSGRVKKIAVNKGDKVEKNDLLVAMGD